MALKHLTRTQVYRPETGTHEEIFLNDDGYEIHALKRFRRFVEEQGNRATSLKRYVEAAARFVDFLIECEVFGRPARPEDIAEALAAYPIFLRDGPDTNRVEFPTLGNYAREIGFAGLAPASFRPVLTGVNHFMALARNEALKAVSALGEASVPVDWLDLRTTFSAIEGVERLSRFERERLKQSMLGGNIRIDTRLERPKRLRSPAGKRAPVRIENRDFPLDRLADLLGAARSHRDRALWSLLAGGGLRLHEALNLRLRDIDCSGGTVRVVDPDLLRFGREMTQIDQLRFKGRVTSEVFLYEPLRTVFWEALGSYLRHEYVGVSDDEDDFLFQKLDTRGGTQPLVRASDTAHQKQFKRAVVRAGVPGPEEAPEHVWTLHSLRHSYGVYMLNHIPVPGGPGLRLTEVQMLMGHKDIASTQIYARHERHIVRARVEAADEFVFAGIDAFDSPGLPHLPANVAARLRATADRIENGEGSSASPLRIAGSGKPS